MIKHITLLFFLSLTVHICSSSDEGDEIFERLVGWFADNGVTYSAEVGLGFPHGVIASAPIEATEKKKVKIVNIPQTLAINEETVKKSDLAPIFEENPSIDSTAMVAIFLLHEKNKEKSLWKPYLDALPKELDTPMFWSKKEQKLLTGSWVLDRVKADEKSLKENYKEVMVDLLFKKYAAIFDPDVYTEDEYIWVWNIIWSRAFWFESTGLVLVPMLDSFNHHNEAKTEIYFEDGHFSLFTKSNVESGAEVYINRGQRPNNDLLRLYGFILPANQYNLAFIEDTLGEKDPIRLGLKKAVLNKHNMLGPPYPYGDTIDGLWVRKDIPLQVIGFYRIKFWEPTTAQMRAWKESQTIPDINPSKMLDEDNEKKTIVGLVDRLAEIIDRYPEGYKEDKTLLQGKELSERARIAVQMRYQEKKILNDARTTLMTPKKSLDRTPLL